MAGWPEYPPDHPKRWQDADPATWDAKLRLQKMDEYGIHAQVLYPNVALFNSALLVESDDVNLRSSTCGSTTTSRPSGAARRPTACCR